MTRTEIVEAYRANVASWDRLHRNQRKLQFMSLTKNNRFAFETYGSQLEQMQAEAVSALAKFKASVDGMTTEEIVSIIEEAGA